MLCMLFEVVVGGAASVMTMQINTGGYRACVCPLRFSR